MQYLLTQQEMDERNENVDDKLRKFIMELGKTMDMVQGYDPLDRDQRLIGRQATTDFIVGKLKEFDLHDAIREWAEMNGRHNG